MGISTIGGTCDCRCGAGTCETCCESGSPEEFDVDITLTDNLCGICDSYLSGTYTVTRTGAGSCFWTFSEGSTSCDPDVNTTLQWCDAGCTVANDCYQLVYRYVEVYIQCNSFVSPNTYTITITMKVMARGPTTMETCFGASARYYYNTYRWDVDVNVSDFNCTTASGVAVPYTSRAYSCCNNTTPTPAYYLCDDTPADATLTAVP
jgi:hypothetical protein